MPTDCNPPVSRYRHVDRRSAKTDSDSIRRELDSHAIPLSLSKADAAQDSSPIADRLRTIVSAVTGPHPTGTLETGIEGLHSALSHEPGFRAALARAQTVPSPDSGHWSWHPIHQDLRVQLGLLTVFRFSRVPIHDHPGAYGAHLVLCGKLQLRRFDLLAPSRAGGSSARLLRVSDDLLQAGDTSALLPNTHNLHDMEAITPRCIVLSLLFPPVPDAARSLYVPLNIFNPNAPVLICNRLRMEALQRQS